MMRKWLEEPIALFIILNYPSILIHTLTGRTQTVERARANLSVYRFARQALLGELLGEQIAVCMEPNETKVTKSKAYSCFLANTAAL